MTAAEAIDFVRAKRGIVCPNVGFRTQLATYSEQFVGGRAKRGGGVITTEGPRLSKISEGIAQRMRRFKSGDTGSTSTTALKQVQVKGAYILEFLPSGILNVPSLSLKIKTTCIRLYLRQENMFYPSHLTTGKFVLAGKNYCRCHLLHGYV